MKIKSNEEKPMALIYCRVSSDRQAKEGHGLESQEHRCREFAKIRNYKVEGVFKDSYSGGGDYMLRPGLQQLFAYLDKYRHKQYIVIIDDLSRFARDVSKHFQLKKDLFEREVRLECSNFNFEDTPEGELIETMMAAQHQYHRRNNTRQVCQKMKARLEAGYWTFNSQVPGYTRKDLPDGQWILVKSDPKASIIKQALEGYANGRFDTKVDIQKFLQRRDYLAGNKQNRVYLSRVDRLLERAPLYAGFIELPEWEVERRPGKHEAIITPAVLQKVEDKLHNRKRVQIREDYSTDFPLRPYVVCAVCGKKLTASWTRSRNGNYHPYYRCSNSSKVCEYGNKSIRRDKMDEEFRRLLSELVPDEKLVKLTEAILKDLYAKKHEEFGASTKQTQREVERMESDIEKLMQRAVNTKSEIMAERFEAEATKLIEEKDGLVANKLSQDTFDQDFGTAADEVMSILKNPVNKWDSEDLEEKRLVIKLVFDGDPVYDKNHGFGTAELSCVIRLFERVGATNSRDVEMPEIESGSAFGHGHDSTVRS